MMTKAWNVVVASLGRFLSRTSWQAYLSLAVLTGLSSIALHATGGEFRTQLGAGFFLAGSSLLGGVLVGFLFAIPKSDSSLGSLTTGQNETNGGSKYSLNTNLEDISDWLSKMIVGVGLVQLTSVPGYIKRASLYWSSSIKHGFPTAYTSTLIIFFCLLGFLVGYLWTRLVLIGDFIRQDPRNVNLQRIESKIENLGNQAPLPVGSAVDQQVVRQQEIKVASDVANIFTSTSVSIDDLRAKIAILSGKYDSIRATMPSGPERTREMESIASQMRGYALAADQLLPEYASSNAAGERLVAIAFLQIKPNKEYFDWLSSRFSIETPFLQYHAAIALRNAVSMVVTAPSEERATFKNVLDKALNHATASAKEHKVDTSQSESILVLKDAQSIFSR
jgi:hypothetical protein